MKEYELGAFESIPDGGARAFEVANKTIAVFRSKDGVFAMSNRCIHKGASMCEGEITPDGSEVRCPWHNWPFNLATGAHRLDHTQRQRTYPVRVEDGQVIVTI